jgi:DnaK suppressor protein
MPAAPRSAADQLQVRPGEEPWTDAELAGVRKELEEEAAGLHADIARVNAGIAERLTDAISDAGDDPADAGAKAFEREQELALSETARALLDHMEYANRAVRR